MFMNSEFGSGIREFAEFGSDQAKDLKSCDNSKKPAPKLGLEAHFQPQNRPSKIIGELVVSWPKVRLEKTGEL